MYSSRILYAIENFVEEKYFLPMHDSYELKEEADDGKSLLLVSTTRENICVEGYDNKKKCGFLRLDKKLGMQKCIDHFILKKNGNVWDLHMIEMKSSVGDRRWLEIKGKVRASYLNICALCEVMGIDIGEVHTYTTYERERFESVKDSADIKTHVPLLGEKATNFKSDEWEKGIIKIKIDDIITFPHMAVKMQRNQEQVLEGALAI